MEWASIGVDLAPCFPIRPRSVFHCRWRDSPPQADAIPGDHAHVRSMALRHDRAERYRGDSGRPRSLFSCHAERGRLVSDRVIGRRLPGQHSSPLDRPDLRRIFSAPLDALGTPALPTTLRGVGLLRVLERSTESRNLNAVVRRTGDVALEDALGQAFQRATQEQQ